MPATRRPEAPARLLAQTLGSAVICVTERRLGTSASRGTARETYALRFTDAPVSLRASAGGPSGLHFDVEHQIAVIAVQPERALPNWRAATRAYQYRLLDNDHRELLVYHWQPGPDFLGPDHPHLHVSAALSAQTSAVDRRTIDLDKLHLPTDRVSLASVVRMLIAEFRVAPLRPDWAERLDSAERAFQEETEQSA